MASTTYNAGTISVGANSTTVTGSGTAWETSGIRPGDRLEANGLSVRISEVVSNTSIKLAHGWPGSAISGGDYDIWLSFDDDRALAAAIRLIARLESGTLSSLGELAGGANKMPYWSGSGVMAEADLSTAARALLARSDKAGMRAELALTKVESTTDTGSGRVTTVGWMGLGESSPDNIADLAEVSKRNGFWTLSGSTEGRPAGVTGNHALSSVITTQRSGDVANRLLLVRDGRLFHGVISPSTGGELLWLEVQTTGSMVGTVSQSDGTPTGAIIERGSNSNGEFVKFADGTQFCWGKKNLGSPTANGEGTFSSPHRTSVENLSLPSSFTTEPDFVHVSASVDESDSRSRMFLASYRGVSTTAISSVQAYKVSGSVGDGDVTVRFFVAGRWY